jgi:hypothetical protein
VPFQLKSIIILQCLNCQKQLVLKVNARQYWYDEKAIQSILKNRGGVEEHLLGVQRSQPLSAGNSNIVISCSLGVVCGETEMVRFNSIDRLRKSQWLMRTSALSFMTGLVHYTFRVQVSHGGHSNNGCNSSDERMSNEFNHETGEANLELNN